MIHLRAFREKIVWGKTAPAIFLMLNSFVWYLLTYVVFNAILSELKLPETEELGLFITYSVGIAVTAIIGAKILPHTRTKSLQLWLFMGTIATALLTTISGDSILTAAFISFFFGASIGIGLPSCFSYFADSTSVENRGVAGGIIWSTVGFIVLFFALLMSTLEPWSAVIALTIWRLFGGIGFLFLNKKYRAHEIRGAQKAPSYLELIRKRQMLLYLFPWIMFSIINFAEAPILEIVFKADFAFVQLIEFAFIGVFAIVGGVIADIAGRKRVVIAGFVMLGIEYAALSAFSNLQFALYLFMTLDGITWGLLYSVFLTVVWGDLGEHYEKEKYYTLGGVPFLLSTILTILIQPYAESIPPSTAFSIASFFLFLAVIPLMYAPETLPEKAIRDRDLKSYTEKALKKAQKETEKSQKKHPEAEKETEKGKGEPEETPEDAEARKLAEKYY
jgi:MFS family permease